MRRVTLAIAIAALSINSAQAGDYIDPRGAYRFALPDGWATVPPPMEEISVVVASPRNAKTAGNCNVVVAADPATKAMSQDEIDRQLSAMMTEAFWRSQLDQVPYYKSYKIEKISERMQHGRKVISAKVVAETNTILGQTTQLQDIEAMPGRDYLVTCTSRSTGFSIESASFALIMNSFEPLANDMASLDKPSASALTASQSFATNLGEEIRLGLRAVKASMGNH